MKKDNRVYALIVVKNNKIIGIIAPLSYRSDIEEINSMAYDKDKYDIKMYYFAIEDIWFMGGLGLTINIQPIGRICYFCNNMSILNKIKELNLEFGNSHYNNED